MPLNQPMNGAVSCPPLIQAHGPGGGQNHMARGRKVQGSYFRLMGGGEEDGSRKIVRKAKWG